MSESDKTLQDCENQGVEAINTEEMKKARENYKKARSLLKENTTEKILEAKKFLESAANARYTHAEYLFGKYLVSGIKFEQDVSKGIEYLQSAASKDHNNAILLLAHLYEFGDIVTINDAMAVKYYTRASELNIQSANNVLGSFYEKGIHGLPKDTEQAIHYYKLAADNGYTLAMFNLSMILASKGDQTYLDYLYKAAEAGLPQAQFNVAIRRDIDKDTKIRYLKSAADSGLSRACYYYAMYTNDQDEKNKYMQLAAEKGYLKALPETAEIMKEKNPQKLRVLLQNVNSSEEDYPVDKSKSQLVLSQLIKEAEGKNYPESLYLRGIGNEDIKDLEAAAETGHRDAKILVSVMKQDIESIKENAKDEEDPAAVNNLAKLYEVGEGVEKDEEKAIELYKKASQKGSEVATFNLIRLLTSKGNIHEAIKVARKEYRTTNNSKSAFELAKVLIENNETEEGIEYLKQSVAKNNTHAMYYYAILLAKGNNVEKDMNQARDLFIKCADLDTTNGAYAFAAAKFSQFNARQKYLETAVNLGYPPAMLHTAKISHKSIAKPLLEKIVDNKDFPTVAEEAKKLLESMK